MELSQSWDGHPLWTLPQLDIEQVPMFLDAHEIIDNVESGEWFSADTELTGDKYDLYPTKLEEAQDQGLYDSIAQHGVRKPIVMRIVSDDYNGTEIWTGNGHHRTAVAAELGQLVPVLWVRDYDVWADDRYHSMESDGYTRLVDLPA